MTRAPHAIPPVAAALLALAVAVAVALAVAPPAFARDGGRDEVRVTGTCGRGAASELRLKADDGAIEIEFRVHHARVGGLWRVTLVRERRVVWRGRARTGSGDDSFRVRRRVRDLPGADRVTARTVGPRGLTCAASGVLPGR
ncbi:MAG TPA: hypothetical protein VLA98_10010 [Solirubrobacteraceae bacterium]|nr:hypothetical protein [Solirubrobacteraceae bacterium]